MSKKAKIRVFIFLVAMFFLFLILGQYLAGGFILWKTGADIKNIYFFLYHDYIMAFGKNPSFKSMTIISTSLASLPVVIIALVVIILVVPKGEMKKLYGDARFSKIGDLKKDGCIFDEEAYKNKNKKHPPLILGEMSGKYIADYSQEAISLAAYPGAGKGVSFVIPNLLQYPDSVIVLDIKLENWIITSGYRSSVLKQKCFLFCPDAGASDDYQTHSWNPLDYVEDDINTRLSSIKKIVSILIPCPEGENQTFYINAQNLVVGITMLVYETDRENLNFSNILGFFRSPLGLDAELKKKLAINKSMLSEKTIGILLSFLSNENKKGKDSTRSIAESFLDIFSSEIVAKATSKSDFDFRKQREEKISIYAGARPGGMAIYGRLFNLFISQAIEQNTQVLPENAPKERPMPYQLLLMLDEFPALGKVDIIKKASGYSRGYNVRFALIFQNEAQLESDDCYGRAGANSILDTVQTTVVAGTRSIQDAKKYSEIIGDKTVRNTSKTKNYGKNGGGSVSIQYFKKPLLLPQDIMSMEYDHMLVFKKGIHPIKCNKIKWYEIDLFIDRANIECPNVPSVINQI